MLLCGSDMYICMTIYTYRLLIVMVYVDVIGSIGLRRLRFVLKAKIPGERSRKVVGPVRRFSKAEGPESGPNWL